MANLSETVEILNSASGEVASRLAGILANLRGPVPADPSGGIKGTAQGGLAGDLERVAGKLNAAAQMVGELEALTSPSQRAEKSPAGIGYGGTTAMASNPGAFRN